MTNPIEIIHTGDEKHILYIARVSSNQKNSDPGLIRWLIDQNHWSPFEMIGACVEINTTRDIGRQILRHRSFSFQEFSQRYAAVESADLAREMRVKGGSNRQGSTDNRDTEMEIAAAGFALQAFDTYDRLIASGVAPECARSVLPEGFAPTRLYMNGTLRSWIHYLRERLKWNAKDDLPWAQREHYRLASMIYHNLSDFFPVTWTAIEDMAYIDEPRYHL